MFMVFLLFRRRLGLPGAVAAKGCAGDGDNRSGASAEAGAPRQGRV
jgi:hypothetical protein